MSKHSKNNCSSMVFTHHEKQQLKYGTISQRIGGDSIKNFDCCSLCLHPAIDPMCCPEGHLFCKECIFGFLLNEKKQIAKQMEKYEEQQRRLQLTEELKQQEQKEQEIKIFDNNMHGVLPTTQPSDVFKAKKEPTSQALVVADGNNNNTTQQRDEKLAGFMDKDRERREAVEESKGKLTAFWVPGVTVATGQDLIAKPSSETHCPDGNHPLRLKQLTSLNFVANRDAAEGRFKCGPCSRALTNASKTVAYKKCGHVICSQCFDSAKKDKACPQCSKKAKDKHIIRLETGGTGYVGSSGDKLKPKVFTAAARV